MWVYTAIHGASANPERAAISSAFFFLEVFHSFPSTRLHRNSAAFYFFYLFFFLFCCASDRATTTHLLLPRDEVIRAYVSEVSILLASHGTGKNRDRIDRNLKRSSGMHYMTARNWFFYGHLIHFARVFFFFRQDRKPPLHSLNVFQSKNISTFIKS